MQTQHTYLKMTCVLLLSSGVSEEAQLTNVERDVTGVDDSELCLFLE